MSITNNLQKIMNDLSHNNSNTLTKSNKIIEYLNDFSKNIREIMSDIIQYCDLNKLDELNYKHDHLNYIINDLNNQIDIDEINQFFNNLNLHKVFDNLNYKSEIKGTKNKKISEDFRIKIYQQIYELSTNLIEFINKLRALVPKLDTFGILKNPSVLFKNKLKKLTIDIILKMEQIIFI